jgi:hypothetical protein
MAEFERVLDAERGHYGPFKVQTAMKALLGLLITMAIEEPTPDRCARVMADHLLRGVWDRHVDAKAGPMPAWWAKGN